MYLNWQGLQKHFHPVGTYHKTLTSTIYMKCVCNVMKCVCVCVCVFSHVDSFVTMWTISQQAPLSMGFPRQEYWSGLPLPTPWALPDPRLKPMFSA